MYSQLQQQVTAGQELGALAPDEQDLSASIAEWESSPPAPRQLRVVAITKTQPEGKTEREGGLEDGAKGEGA
eukprot:6020110-Prymnesium_polylepis.1